MPIQDKLLGRYKYPNYDITYEDFLREQERKKKIQLREERRKKLEEFKEKELIKQIDIDYRIKKLKEL